LSLGCPDMCTLEWIRYTRGAGLGLADPGHHDRAVALIVGLLLDEPPRLGEARHRELVVAQRRVPADDTFRSAAPVRPHVARLEHLGRDPTELGPERRALLARLGLLPRRTHAIIEAVPAL